jgi:hypothetical protein
MTQSVQLPPTETWEEAREFWDSVWEETKFDSLPEKVKAELSDYSKMLDTWGHVAFDLSGGRLSKPNYTADVYRDVFEENLQEAVEEERLALLEEIAAWAGEKLIGQRHSYKDKSANTERYLLTKGYDRAIKDLLTALEDLKGKQ